MRWKHTFPAALAAGTMVLVIGGALAQQAQQPVTGPTTSDDKPAPRSLSPEPMPEHIDTQTGFAVHAFPPTIPDRDWHRDAWIREDCLACHETGVQEAPIVRHRGLPALTLQAKCRSCHVLIPGITEARPREARPPEENDNFAPDAFPPMMPNTSDHVGAWGKSQCLVCHETGVGRAPVVNHGPRIPRLALIVQCRTCHVQVRSTETSPWDR